MNHFFRLFLTLIPYCLACFPAFGQSNIEIIPKDVTSEGKRIYNTRRIVSQPPKIDGVLDEICWTEGYWSGGYRQNMPSENAEPSQKTELKILFDDENIYAAIRAYDNHPEKIDRQIGRRDAFAGDIVGVCFDSYFDHRTGFEFDLTAAGNKIDLILLNDRWDTNWNPVWYGKVGLEDSAWVAEFQIPLSQLRYGNQEEHTWGLHSWRWINRYQEED
ncbi:MAG TPA: carbohydrate binding family 9 domain-containing protein, partial [Cyclobacteriaceae bacterium]|nr:carbohydrate binding family 9 domain-containing protein [Cyclobacteriaceae bacterium]